MLEAFFDEMQKIAIVVRNKPRNGPPRPGVEHTSLSGTQPAGVKTGIMRNPRAIGAAQVVPGAAPVAPPAVGGSTLEQQQ